MHRLPKPAGAKACEAAELGGPSRSTLTTSTGSRRRFDELYGPMPKKRGPACVAFTPPCFGETCISGPTLPGHPRRVPVMEGGPASPNGCLPAAYAAVFGVEPWIGRISRNDE
jgi:hypothetical protein